MKKKIFIVSLIIVILFLLILAISLKQSTKIEPDQTEEDKAALQTEDDFQAAQVINGVYNEFPWYENIPIVTDDFTIAFNFDRRAFRIRLLKSSTAAIKQAAVNHLESIGVDTKKFEYYFIEPEKPEAKPGFENLLN